MSIKKEIISKIKWKIVVQVFMSLIATFSLAMIPACNKYLVDYVLPNKGKNFAFLVIIYLVSYFIFLFATWGSERYVWKCAIIFENSLKKLCFRRVFGKSFRSFSKQKSDEYLSLITNNITSIEQDYLQPICALIKSILSVCVYVVLISIYTSPMICAFLILLSMIATFVPKINKRSLSKAGKEYVDGAAVYTQKIADLLDGFELVDTKSRKQFIRQNEKFTDFLSQKRLLLGRKKVNGNTISGAAICFIDVLTFLLCGIMLIYGNITAGTVLAAITYAQSFTEPIQEILYDINTLNASREIVDSLEKELEDTGENQDNKERTFTSNLRLCDLKVIYPDKKLSYTADFFVGSKYMILGESGSGKSTLLNALMTRCDFEGDLFVDGKKGILSTDNVFYLNQNQHVFGENFWENTTIFGTYSLPEKRILLSLPLYESINEALDCTKLSGGEQQVLKICRMLSQEKNILLLDEPFSAVDIENRQKLFHFLSSMDATIIMVTHDRNFNQNDLCKWKIVKIEDICYES